MSNEGHSAAKKSGPVRFLPGAVPLLIVSVLVAVFGYQLLFGNDPHTIPSALIGEPVPTVDLPPLKRDKPGFGPGNFGGGPILVNVFASWCKACRAEHPIIGALVRDHGIPVYGLNSKDSRDAALRWLATLGDPYTRIGYDPHGRAGIEWGVYGYPETFLINAEGDVVYKYVGPITPRVLKEEFLPRIEALRKS